MNEEYFKNVEPYLIKLNVDLNRLYAAFDIMDTLFEQGSFSRQFIEDCRKQFDENTLCKEQLILFDTTLVNKPEDVKTLLEKFDKLFDDEEFIEKRFHDHRNELTLALLLIHNAYWAVPVIDVVKSKKLKKDTTYNDLSEKNKNLFQLQELAQVVEILISYQEKGINTSSSLLLQYSNKNAKLSSQIFQDWVIDALEKKLDQSTFGEIGDSMGIALEYFEAKEKNDYTGLKARLKNIKRRDAFKAQSPIKNEAITNISLLIRHYLQTHELLPKNTLLPSIFLKFMSKSFEIFGIRVSEFKVADTNDIENLKKIISPRVKKLIISSQKNISV
ncbi:hypothetical protein [Pedobacter helvus]|uniref:Uncharacterized protein n=1 Tax=Pedobacter helvus TaxID=2563444 RepID=A0ABW9JCH5_9SPHI|nr:hypothetical protein [Pedobacter ureilyticus]